MQVGIIGGGQLAMMLCEAAKKLGIKTVVLDPNSNCSATQVCDDFICAQYSDVSSLEKLAAICDVVTYEFENVDVDAIDDINHKYHNIVQTSKPLKLSNDRLVEKQYAEESGFDPAIYAEINCIEDIHKFVDIVGLPIVLKTRRLGYDGKGQVVIDDLFDLENAESIIESGAIAEKMIDLEYETSVIAIRNSEGQCQFIPSTINTHRNNILFKTETMNCSLDSRIKSLVVTYLEFHNLVGIVTVEVFASKDGEIYFNEIAPRPHNSGHWSIEGCNHSQFDMHLRAICNIELPTVKIIDRTVMLNVLGQDYVKTLQFMESNQCDSIYFHDYYKSDIVVNRKMGHLTAVGSEAIELLENFEKKL